MSAVWLQKFAQSLSKLTRRDAQDHLRPKARVCRDFLIEHRDRQLSKNEILTAVWPGRIVTEQSLFQCIAEIRAHHGQHSVRTIPGFGYQWRQRSPARQPALFAGLALVLAAAAGGLAITSSPDETPPDPLTIALLPVSGDAAGIEHALTEWLSMQVPAVLVNGVPALALANSGDTDLVVGLSVAAGDGVFAADYRITTREQVIEGTLSSESRTGLVDSLGSFVRETLIGTELIAVDRADRLVALYRTALARLMAGQHEAALAYASTVIAEDAFFLPAQLLMVELELWRDDLDAAERRADGMLATGQTYRDPAWITAGHLARAKVLSARAAPTDARQAALAALRSADANGLTRQAGKAAEHLAALDLDASRSDGALRWLVDAHRYYSEGHCTVGTSRVERKFRELFDQFPATG